MIPAHDSPLAALAFDASGTKLATASEKVGKLLYSALTCWVTALFVADPFCCRPLSNVFVSAPLRAQLFASSQSQRDRNSLSSEEESRGRRSLVLDLVLVGKSRQFNSDPAQTLFESPSLSHQVCEHLFAGFQHGGPVPVCLQQHRDGPHLQVGDTEGEVRVRTRPCPRLSAGTRAER